MTIIDPIADMFTRIRNALQVEHEKLELGYSKIKKEICEVLVNEGFIQSCEVENSDLLKKTLRIKLKYDDNGQSMIEEIKRVSKPSKRIYVQKSEIPKVLNGFGICMLSTSKGILSGRDARLKNVGGELIGIVY